MFHSITFGGGTHAESLAVEGATYGTFAVGPKGGGRRAVSWLQIVVMRWWQDTVTQGWHGRHLANEAQKQVTQGNFTTGSANNSASSNTQVNQSNLVTQTATQVSPSAGV